MAEQCLAKLLLQVSAAGDSPRMNTRLKRRGDWEQEGRERGPAGDAQGRGRGATASTCLSTDLRINVSYGALKYISEIFITSTENILQ